MYKNISYIIDFDSTFVRLEALDKLSELALKDHPRREEITQKISSITKQGMEGIIPFATSLRYRISLFQPTKEHIVTLVTGLKRNITDSIKRNKQFFLTNKDSIYIISGGFVEYIAPVVKSFGIDEKHILANTFVFDKKGKVIGYDEKNLLSQNLGKVKVVKNLKLKTNVRSFANARDDKNKIIVIGDGITDYQIKERGVADSFYCFTENISRTGVMAKADAVVKTFDEFLFLRNLPRNQSFPKSKMKVLLLENIDALAIEIFEKEGFSVRTIKSALDEKDLSQKLRDVSILGIRSKTEVTNSVLQSASKLLTIGAFCIGTNQIDLKASTQRGVAVFNAPYSNTRSVVELALGEILMLFRKTLDKSMKLHKGEWDKSASGSFEVRGKRLGIIGYGNIGTQLGVLAENLGMDVYFYDVVDKLALGNAKKCKTLHELLRVCDVITVHVDGRIANKNLISEHEFKLMKKGVIFLNLSRGFIVDTEALAGAIKEGRVGGCAVDVFPHEPKSNSEQFRSPLQNLPNTILTPHIGGSTEEAQRNIGEFVAVKLVDFINSGNTLLSVNIPEIQLPPLTKTHRFLHMHENRPGILAAINNIMAKHTINIEGQYLKTNDQVGYVITDVNKEYGKSVIDELREIDGTIRLRVLY